MKNKKIVVLVKYYKGELNVFDATALECAIASGSNDVTALTMAPRYALPIFRGLTRLGVKCVAVSDAAYAGSDTIATSYILSKAVERLDPDYIFCGRQSIDGDTAQVPPMLSERLNFDLITDIIDFNGEEIKRRCGDTVIPKEHSVLTFERFRNLRFPSIFSTEKDIEIWDNTVLGLDRDLCGLNGSPTRVIGVYETNVGRRFCRFCSLNELDTLIHEGLGKTTEIKQTESTEKLKKVCYVGDISDIANSIGENVVRINIDGKTADDVAREIDSLQPEAVLWHDDSNIRIMASRVAVKMNIGLCADCISFSVNDGKLVMTRPAQGESVTADIICNGKMSFATVRTAKKDCSDIVFAVGYGAKDHIDKIKKLAKKYNADLCCSRIMVDTGIMPYEYQVGLTGKRVSPKVYVAFGISGSVQHTCAISGTKTIIAVNNVKSARMFDYSDYGIVADISDI